MGKKFKKISTVKYVEAVIIKETMDKVLSSLVTEAVELEIIVKSEATERR